MMLARLLAGAWRAANLRWYLGTAATLAVAITVLAGVGGTLAGMQAATEERVAAFYTDGLRIAPDEAGALPPAPFGDLDAARRLGEGRVQFESQAVLSRRSLEAAALEPQRLDVDTPTGAGGRNAVALAALVGVGQEAGVQAGVGPYLVAGGLPAGPWNATGENPIPLVMGADRFRRFLTGAEQDALGWPPTTPQLGAFRFYVTAGRLENGSIAGGGSVIVREARVVGLFDSNVDLLDAFTVLAPIEAVRVLNGHAPDAPVANALLLPRDDPDTRKAAQAQGWHAQGSHAFAQRYLGQLVQILTIVSLLATASLFMLPAFLVLHGVTRLLETHQREIAVLRAVGAPAKAIGAAVVQLAGRLLGEALAAAAVLTALVGLALRATLPGLQGMPLPMGFDLPLWLAVLAATLCATAVAGAVALALRSSQRADLASALRTF